MLELNSDSLSPLLAITPIGFSSPVRRINRHGTPMSCPPGWPLALALV
jgi:hypothetical protein